jgi:hypothetical protein
MDFSRERQFFWLGRASRGLGDFFWPGERDFFLDLLSIDKKYIFYV